MPRIYASMVALLTYTIYLCAEDFFLSSIACAKRYTNIFCKQLILEVDVTKI